MKSRFFLTVFALAISVFVVLPSAGLASDRDDHERARRALEAGEVLPLRTVLERVERDYPGQIIEVELERDDGMWFYEVKLIRSGGAVIELKLDARDGAVHRIKGRDIRSSDRREDTD